MFTEFQQHRHTGTDGQKINPKDLLGFPVFDADPTHKAKEGTIVLVNDDGTYKLSAFINKGWRSIELT